ncbi:hypothetical protein AAC387_Pa01g2398 [Persea americana]
MVPLLVALLMSLSHSLNLEDLIVQVLKFVCPSHSLFKSGRWHNTRGIPLNDRVKSLKELCYFLLHGVNQFGGISRQPLELGAVLFDSHATLHELLEFDGLLPLHMRRYILITELPLEVSPSFCICHSSLFSPYYFPPYIC